MTMENFYFSHPIKKVTIDGNKWEYITCGKGEKTLLVFPGGGQTAQLNFNIIKEMENEFKIIAVTIHSIDSIDEFNKAVNHILEKESAGKVYLYGLSIGALLAQSYLRRNKERIEKVILSHGCAPGSLTYEKKVIRPLRIIKIFSPVIPEWLIKLITKKFAGQVQRGFKNKPILPPRLDGQTLKLLKTFTDDFYENYLDKRLLKTWINLHLDFYNNEKFCANDLNGWKGKILILRTDNDPVMQDDGEFKKLYPHALVHTFKGTGHLSFYYKSDEMIKIMKNFLRTL